MLEEPTRVLHPNGLQGQSIQSQLRAIGLNYRLALRNRTAQVPPLEHPLCYQIEVEEAILFRYKVAGQDSRLPMIS